MQLDSDEVRVFFAAARRREHTAAGRALLRAVLGDVEVIRGPHGKPAIEQERYGSFGVCAPQDDRRGLHFNISHSGELVALAIAREAVGIDVEEIREMRDLLGIARRFFSAEEAQRVEEDGDQFFRIWTAKEAVVKAIGSGVSDGLQSFTVPRDLRAPAVVQGREEWVVCAIEPPLAGYRAAVAMPATRRWRISCAPCASLDSCSG
jgi:4'-phosphopantetheinyl transferase